MAKKLTPKQKRFTEEYLVDLNASQAAIRAGYSPKTAGAIGTENLNKPLIAAELSRLMAERSERTSITADGVLARLYELSVTDMADVATWSARSVKLKKSAELPPEITRAIQTVKETKDGVSLTFYPKTQALELLGKHLGIFKEKAEIDLTLTDKNGLVDQFLGKLRRYEK